MKIKDQNELNFLAGATQKTAVKALFSLCSLKKSFDKKVTMKLFVQHLHFNVEHLIFGMKNACELIGTYSLYRNIYLMTIVRKILSNKFVYPPYILIVKIVILFHESEDNLLF